ncbi:DNase I-like protein [Dioscorea alata]|uniref:DNase I-like protein n=1 Tax=Dioscorea alata TaxID=55571 RepID=A0ACB7UM67_DIOAL|nr:DNase I-like protein [Dioscorea alata]
MKFIFWNCIGLGSPKTVRELRDLVSHNKPLCIFLMEVKIAHSRVDAIRYHQGFQSLFHVDNVNNGGGLALLWRENLQVHFLSFSYSHIDVAIKCEGFDQWRLT